MIKEEGLLVGGSCGANVWAAVEVAKKMGKGKRIVTLLPDSTRNYMTKFLMDKWMVLNGFMRDPNADKRSVWAQHNVGMLNYSMPVTVSPNLPCIKVVDILKANGYSQLPVVTQDGAVLGVVTEGNLSSYILSGRVKAHDPCEKCLFKKHHTVTTQTTLGQLAAIFEQYPFALVTTTQQSYDDNGEVSSKTVVSGIVTRIDLMNYLKKANLLSE